MKILIPVPVLLTLVLPVRAHAETYQATAPSEISVQIRPDGVAVHRKSVRYEVEPAIPDDIKVGVPFDYRLLTITTVSDRENDDETNTVAVTVDALTGPVPRRIAAFSDAGSEGVASPPYFITTQSGCCSPLTRHHVRNIETGTLLFTATGSSQAGLVALMNVPNHHPTIERWVAFEGRPETANENPTLLGILRYGGRDGAIDTLALRMDAADQPPDFMIALPECGALRWVETSTPPGQSQPPRPPDEACFTSQYLSYSKPLFSLEHRAGPLGGFALQFSLDGKVYADIPVADDHLDIAHATLARGMSLVPVGR